MYGLDWVILPFRDCQVAGASPKGVGGRMADVLAAGSQKLLRDKHLSIQESTFGSCARYVCLLGYGMPKFKGGNSFICAKTIKHHDLCLSNAVDQDADPELTCEWLRMNVW